MCVLLGVNSTAEFSLLPVVKHACEAFNWTMPPLDAGYHRYINALAGRDDDSAKSGASGANKPTRRLVNLPPPPPLAALELTATQKSDLVWFRKLVEDERARAAQRPAVRPPARLPLPFAVDVASAFAALALVSSLLGSSHSPHLASPHACGCEPRLLPLSPSQAVSPWLRLTDPSGREIHHHFHDHVTADALPGTGRRGASRGKESRPPSLVCRPPSSPH